MKQSSCCTTLPIQQGIAHKFEARYIHNRQFAFPLGHHCKKSSLVSPLRAIDLVGLEQSLLFVQIVCVDWGDREGWGFGNMNQQVLMKHWTLGTRGR
jgi:hypothetical protein